MANPKARRLPSGNYYCQVRIEGLPSESFTGTNKREVEKAALLYKLTAAENKKPDKMTVGTAYDKYIKIMSGTLSPSTITGYKRLRKNTFQSIMGIRLDKLTQDDVQLAVNEMNEAGRSPKYIRNAHGLLSAVLSRYARGFTLDTRLPQKRPSKYNVPSEAEIAAIQTAVAGTDIEVPVLLAIGCGLRMSEIRGLEWRDVRDNKVYVERAIVDTLSGPVQKAVPKSESGNRSVPLTPRLLELLSEPGAPGEKVVTMSASAITGRLDTILRHAEIPHFKFHEFRHSYASVMLAIGIPNKYAAGIMGHKSTYMLDKVYQQLMSEYEDKFADQITGYYDNLDKKCSQNADRT